MSGKHLQRAARVPGLGPSAKLVLLALADYASLKTGEAWPSVRRIQKWTGLSRSTVHRAIATIIAAELVSADPVSKGGVTHYRLMLPVVDMKTSNGRESGSKKQRGGVSPRHRGGVMVTQGVCHGDTGGSKITSQETPRNKGRNPKIDEEKTVLKCIYEKNNEKGIADMRKKDRKTGTGIRVAEIAADIDPTATLDNDIIALGFRSDGSVSPSSVMKAWRRALAKYRPGPALPVATVKETAAARNLIRRYGKLAPAIVVNAVAKWSVFVSRVMAEGLSEGKPVPGHPDIQVVLRYAVVAVNLGYRPKPAAAVQTSARKPAPKPKAEPVAAPKPGDPGAKLSAEGLAEAERLYAKYGRLRRGKSVRV